MFKFIKQTFTALLSFSESLATKFISLNDYSTLVKPTLFDLNQNEVHYCRFMVGLDWCNGTCNVLDDAFGNACVHNKKKDVNLDAFNSITKITDQKR